MASHAIRMNRTKMNTNATRVTAASGKDICASDQTGFRNALAGADDAQASSLATAATETVALQSTATEATEAIALQYFCEALEFDSPNAAPVRRCVQRLVALLINQVNHHRVR